MEKYMKEEWRPVRGKEDYAEISNLGQIHRFERVWYTGRSHQIKRIQEEDWTYGNENGKGYLQAKIGGVNKGVHVWVYMTFHDCDIPKGLEVNHIDENKHNNRLDNLNLMTSKKNKNWGTRNKRIAAAHRGMKQTTETIEKRAASNRGQKRSEATKAKIAAAHMGMKPSEETRKKMSDAHRGKYNTKNSKPIQALDKVTGEVVFTFPSAKEAERQYGFSAEHISACCLGKLKTHKGYIWKCV